MSDREISDREPRLVAIIPCNDLDAAEAWWNRLGFRRPPDQDYPGYRMLADDEGSEVHLNQSAEGWVVPSHNPFGVYLYTRRVAQIAAAMRGFVIEPGKAPEHKPWGMYECALHGPDGLLVRIGWPSRLVEG
ncbi:VOC family protein [Hephaestia sp. GCM10023244]|uniref:VOC family protein n=1 Tax=unclassified Hephaestia TaxID=2631281 RepID=UPI002076EDC7|nr:VOC family protein [Hephaestia sp. MAHUQ-44]MCM8729605.1 VOC family protein [Hephaestia sp. MAHUQ-44]